MATEKWAAFTSRSTVLTSEMDSLINGAYTAAGTELDNGTNLDRFAVAVLLFKALASAPDLNSVCRLYAIAAIDGTNYEDGSASLRPTEATFCGVFQVYNNTSDQRLRTAPFELVPSKQKFILFNGTGKTFAASASTVTIFTTNRTIA